MNLPVLPREVALLLPGPDEAPSCSDYTTAIGLAPQGTALELSMVVLVETPLPWPKPAFAHERLSGLDNVFDSPVGRARAFATHPTTSAAGGPIKITCFWRDGVQTQAAVLSADDGAAVHRCLNELREAEPTASSFVTADPAPRNAVLVCTQGSHDSCCGASGTRLAAELELTRPDIRLYRISHTGGHKFAPSVLTLPDGRMWARPTAADIESIVDRSGDTAQLARKCRGWWGAATGPAQAAEVAVLAAAGWQCNDLERVVDVEPRDETTATVTITAPHRRWRVSVERTRVVPAIACRAEGGLPAKMASEYRAELLTEG